MKTQYLELWWWSCKSHTHTHTHTSPDKYQLERNKICSSSSPIHAYITNTTVLASNASNYNIDVIYVKACSGA